MGLTAFPVTVNQGMRETDVSTVCIFHLRNEPLYEETNNLGFRPGPTQTGLYSHCSRLEA